MSARGNAIAALGFALLAGTYLASLWRLRPQSPEGRDLVVRIAHRHLDEGVQRGLDEAARAYERENPRVHIKQLAIPERVWAQWVRTQLVGNTAPELIELGTGIDDELTARFFRPLGDIADRPNPENEGTSLEGRVWRNTFIDGLNNAPNFNLALMETYGIPLTMFTQRMFYNRALLREISGRDTPPTEFEAFMALCRTIADRARNEGRPLVPFAAARDANVLLLGPPWQQQTAPLRERWDVTGQLIPYGFDIALSFLRGEWGLDDAEVRRAFALQRRLALNATPGFTQLNRDDALFAFLQQRAVFVVSGSWDVGTLIEHSGLDVGIARLPLPDASHPEFGGGNMTRLSEGSVRTEASFGVVHGSPEADAGLKFLQFLGSKRGSEIFSQASSWLPALVEVEPSEAARPFAPELVGHPPGLLLTSVGGADAALLIQRELHRLVSPNGSVEEFVSALATRYPAALRQGMARHWRSNLNHLLRQDGATLAHARLAAARGSDLAGAATLALAIDTQNEMEANRAWFHFGLSEID